MRHKDLTSQQFGHLTALKPVGIASDGAHINWLCQCDCGKQTKVSSSHLLSGHTTSCGHILKNRSKTFGNGYDERRVNGVATFLLDRNRKVRPDNTTGVTGVKEVKYRDGSIHYRAQITVNHKRTTLGTFVKLEDAIDARQKADAKYNQSKRDTRF